MSSCEALSGSSQHALLHPLATNSAYFIYEKYFHETKDTVWLVMIKEATLAHCCYGSHD